MDIFHIESPKSSKSATVVSASDAITADDDDEIVSFNAGSDFNLNFFETNNQPSDNISASDSNSSCNISLQQKQQSIKSGKLASQVH